MVYRYEARTIEGFVQQLAVQYVTKGYWFYVTGIVPKDKDPRRIDQKLLAKYEVDISKWARSRRKAAGLANVHYLRHERFFVLLATHGNHRFFDEEKVRVKDCRRVPIKFASYAISYRGGHAHVRIERETSKDLKAYLAQNALRQSTEWLGRTLQTIPFEPYAPVRRQVWTLFKHVNEIRDKAGLERVDKNCLRMRRRIYRPFE